MTATIHNLLMSSWLLDLLFYAMCAVIAFVAFLILFVAGFLLRYWHENDFKNFF